jgi:hypothetical protein
MGIARVYRYQLSVDFLVCLYSSILLFFGRLLFFVSDMLDEFVLRAAFVRMLGPSDLQLVVCLPMLSRGLDPIYDSFFFL